MLRKLFVLPALGLLLSPAMAQAVVEHDYGFNPGNWELTASAQAQNDRDFHDLTGAANVALGYFVSDNLELAIRQTVNYSDVGVVGGGGSGTFWSFATDVAADWHFDLGQWQPFIGANIGFIYGDVNNTWEAGPEGGVKYFLNTSTFIFVMAQYEFFFNEGDVGTDAFSNGLWRYSLGLGVKL
jgi:hypothetical protein